LKPLPSVLGALCIALVGCGSAESTPTQSTPTQSTPTQSTQEPAAMGSAVSEPTPVPQDDGDMSLFLLELAMEDQAERPFTLEAQRGQPVLLTFFYASCDTMCPMIVSDVRAVEAALPEDVRAELRVVLVTIDPEHDTAARLREVASERGLPLERWSLVRGASPEVRTRASAIGMNYRPTPDGFAHNAILTVLDENGVVATQSLGTGQPVEPLVRSITEIARRSR